MHSAFLCFEFDHRNEKKRDIRGAHIARTVDFTNGVNAESVETVIPSDPTSPMRPTKHTVTASPETTERATRQKTAAREKELNVEVGNALETIYKLVLGSSGPDSFSALRDVIKANYSPAVQDDIHARALQTEEMSHDPRTGHVVTRDLANYHVPAHADVPGDMQVVFLEERDDMANPIQTKGIGELGISGAGAAVFNAIAHATGARVRDFPALPDRVIAAMDGAA